MLGLPCRECWSEIWHVLKPLIDSPFQGGPATWDRGPIAALRELGARSAEAKSAEEACLAASEMLAKSPKDVPFALIYLLEHEGKSARLVAATRVPATEAVAPSHVRLTDEAGEDGPWRMAEAVRTEALVTLDDLTMRLALVPPGRRRRLPGQAGGSERARANSRRDAERPVGNQGSRPLPICDWQ